MDTKQRRIRRTTSNQVVHKKLRSATNKPLEVALLRPVHQYNFDLDRLLEYLTETHPELDFSRVQYKDISRLVSLGFTCNVRDIGVFELHCPRIPAPLHMSIVEDMDIMKARLGFIGDYFSLQARSQYISPIFNRLVDVFHFIIRDRRGSVIEDWATTKGTIEYKFHFLGIAIILLVDVKYELGGDKERNSIVAQVTSKCDARYWENTQRGIHIPIYGILFDGSTFQFFKFGGGAKRVTFLRGSPAITSCRYGGCWNCFIPALHPVCAVIFDLLLVAYKSSLRIWRKRLELQGIDKEALRKKLASWDQAIKFASEALVKARSVENLRKMEKIDQDDTVEKAFKAVGRSVQVVPSMHYSGVNIILIQPVNDGYVPCARSQCNNDDEFVNRCLDQLYSLDRIHIAGYPPGGLPRGRGRGGLPRPRVEDGGRGASVGVSYSGRCLKSQVGDQDVLPSFAQRLYAMVQDPRGRDLVYWTSDGASFGFQIGHSFTSQVLKVHFQTWDLQTLVEQLNRHGFQQINQRTRHLRDCEFKHPKFLRGHPELLVKITANIQETRYARSILATAPGGEQPSLVHESFRRTPQGSTAHHNRGVPVDQLGDSHELTADIKYLGQQLDKEGVEDNSFWEISKRLTNLSRILWTRRSG